MEEEQVKDIIDFYKKQGYGLFGNTFKIPAKQIKIYDKEVIINEKFLQILKINNLQIYTKNSNKGKMYYIDFINTVET